MFVDTNLLRLFLVLYDELNVSAAAARVGVTQPAMSHSLSRLRTLLGDPLFVRGPRGLTPTARATALEPELRQAFQAIWRALHLEAFEPRSATRRFTVAAGPYVCESIIPDLVRRAREAAPQAQLHIWKHSDSLHEKLDSGVLDMVVGGFDRVPKRFEHEPLFTEEMVWVGSARHAAARAGLSDDELAALPRLSVTAAEALPGEQATGMTGGLHRRMLIDAGDRQSRTGAQAVTVYDNRTAIEIIAGSDLVALLPRRLAERHPRTSELQFFAAASPARSVMLSMIWHAKMGRDPGLAWLRDVVREASAPFAAR